MNIQTEPEYQYEIPGYPQRNSDEAIVTTAMMASLVIVLLLGAIYWGVILWRLPSKAGYQGWAKWVWFLLLYFPLTGSLALFAFVFVPWPVKKSLEKSESQLEELRRLAQPKVRAINANVDDELDQMRRNLRG